MEEGLFVVVLALSASPAAGLARPITAGSLVRHCLGQLAHAAEQPVEVARPLVVPSWHRGTGSGRRKVSAGRRRRCGKVAAAPAGAPSSLCNSSGTAPRTKLETEGERDMLERGNAGGVQRRCHRRVQQLLVRRLLRHLDEAKGWLRGGRSAGRWRVGRCGNVCVCGANGRVWDVECGAVRVRL